MKKNRLLLIDGNSIINRAFFALPPMDNGQGLHTNAIYGFLTMLFKMIKNYEPSHISVAFDMKAPTFRYKSYTEYKAGRKKMPGELAMQLQPLKDVLDKMNIDRQEIEGYEADDILGTLSLDAEKEGYEVYIVTGDRDAIQLASENTRVLITKKGVGEVEEYDAKAVMERYSLTPDQFIDLKGLMGDKSDNIPGIPGIGEKTGIKLLLEYKTVQGVLDNVDKLKGAQKKKVEENMESALMSKDLATIFREVPLDYSLDQMAFGDFSMEDLVKTFQDLKFNSLIARLNDLVGQEDQELDIDICQLTDFDGFIDQAKDKGHLYMKIFRAEENILDKAIYMTYLSLESDKIYRVHGDDIARLKPILEAEEIEKIGYEMKADYVALKPYGIDLRNMAFDIAIAEYVIDSKTSTSYDIDSISSKYIYKTIMSKEDLLGKGAKALSYDRVELERLDQYVGGMLSTIMGAYPKMKKIIDEDQLTMLFYDVEMPLVEVLAEMEY